MFVGCSGEIEVLFIPSVVGFYFVKFAIVIELPVCLHLGEVNE